MPAGKSAKLQGDSVFLSHSKSFSMNEAIIDLHSGAKSLSPYKKQLAGWLL